MPKQTRSRPFILPKPVRIVGALLLLEGQDNVPVYFERPVLLFANERGVLCVEIEDTPAVAAPA